MYLAYTISFDLYKTKEKLQKNGIKLHARYSIFQFKIKKVFKSINQLNNVIKSISELDIVRII